MSQFMESVWVRPIRGSVSEPALTRPQIVRCAIELLDAEGAAGLSMRRLGVRLKAGATSVYWHVANKDELLELAVDEVLGELRLPEVTAAGWRAGLSEVAAELRQVLLRHRWAVGQLAERPILGPNAMRMGDRVLALIEAAGIDGASQGPAAGTVSSYVFGTCLVEAAMRPALDEYQGATTVPDELEPFLTEAGRQNPHYDKWRRANIIGDVPPGVMLDRNFAFGLERVLDGLEAWPGRQA